MARRHRPRPKPRRPPPSSKPRILILCEGQKTEHIYFAALKVEMRLRSVRVWRPSKVRGLRGLTVAADEARRNDADLDEIWCVLDHDGRFDKVGGCEQVTHMLQRYTNDYRKGDRRFIEGLSDRRDQAIQNAAQAAGSAR